MIAVLFPSSYYYGQQARRSRTGSPWPEPRPSLYVITFATSPLEYAWTDLIAGLGASLHEALHLINADTAFYDKLDLHYDRKQPTTSPCVVSLPSNGFRLRFDGPDQRLRLIEVVDFSKIRLSYKGSELVKDQAVPGPPFKRIYQLFGASYPGEYIPPQSRSGKGKYVLSWSGIAFDFPLQHSAWAADKDHVSMLGSSAASPAVSLALFEGNSWPDVRDTLFTKTPSGPRLSATAKRPKDALPAEIEIANVYGDQRVELVRRNQALPFTFVINETTLQDLTTELGPPDTTHKRTADTAPVEKPSARNRRASNISNGRPHPGSGPSSYSSTGTDTFDADFDSGDADEDPQDRSGREVFWCYFSHGMDILVGPPNGDNGGALGASAHLVVLKVILHGNVPGSYAFNRHRRLRWVLKFPDKEYLGPLNSETPFKGASQKVADGTNILLDSLLHVFKGVWPESKMRIGKVVNRTWDNAGGGGMGDSSFFLPDAEKELVEGSGSEQWLGNTELYAFPGLGFEVLDGGAVAALTIH